MIARIEALEDLLHDATETATGWYLRDEVGNDLDLSDEAEELRHLKALAEEASGSPDWVHGESLIRESHFQAYAEQLADDLDLIPSNAAWPNNCIDWERAARELKYEYFEVDFAGVTYLIRA